MAEPEAAVDVAALRRAHWSFLSQTGHGRDVCVLCNEPCPCRTDRALAELTQSRARAERLEAENTRLWTLLAACKGLAQDHDDMALMDAIDALAGDAPEDGRPHAAVPT